MVGGPTVAGSEDKRCVVFEAGDLKEEDCDVQHPVLCQCDENPNSGEEMGRNNCSSMAMFCEEGKNSRYEGYGNSLTFSQVDDIFLVRCYCDFDEKNRRLSCSFSTWSIFCSMPSQSQRPSNDSRHIRD